MFLWYYKISVNRSGDEFEICPEDQVSTIAADVLTPCAFMMTSSNGNIFRVTGRVTGHL